MKPLAWWLALTLVLAAGTGVNAFEKLTVTDMAGHWLTPWVNTNVDLSWYDRQYTDDANTDNLRADAFALVDVKFWRDFGEHFTAALAVKNLFDEERTVTPAGTGTVGGVDYSRSAYGPGREVIGTVTLRF